MSTLAACPPEVTADAYIPLTPTPNTTTTRRCFEIVSPPPFGHRRGGRHAPTQSTSTRRTRPARSTHAIHSTRSTGGHSSNDLLAREASSTNPSKSYATTDTRSATRNSEYDYPYAHFTPNIYAHLPRFARREAVGQTFHILRTFHILVRNTEGTSSPTPPTATTSSSKLPAQEVSLEKPPYEEGHRTTTFLSCGETSGPERQLECSRRGTVSKVGN